MDILKLLSKEKITLFENLENMEIKLQNNQTHLIFNNCCLNIHIYTYIVIIPAEGLVRMFRNSGINQKSVLQFNILQ